MQIKMLICNELSHKPLIRYRLSERLLRGASQGTGFKPEKIGHDTIKMPFARCVKHMIF